MYCFYGNISTGICSHKFIVFSAINLEICSRMFNGFKTIIAYAFTLINLQVLTTKNCRLYSHKLTVFSVINKHVFTAINLHAFTTIKLQVLQKKYSKAYALYRHKVKGFTADFTDFYSHKSSGP